MIVVVDIIIIDYLTLTVAVVMTLWLQQRLSNEHITMELHCA